MKEWYPYRFKTLKEFEKKFGKNWRSKSALCGFANAMDYLLGQPYPFNIDIADYTKGDYLPDLNCSTDIFNRGYWKIKKFMLTKNEPVVPNYKPRKIEKTI